MSISIAGHLFTEEAADEADADSGIGATLPMPVTGGEDGELAVVVYPPDGEEPTEDQRAAVQWVLDNDADLLGRVEACVFEARSTVYAEPWDDDLVSNPTSPGQIRDEWSIARVDVLADAGRPRYGRLVVEIDSEIDEEHGFSVIIERESRLPDQWATGDTLFTEDLQPPDPDMDEEERAEIAETAACQTARGADHPVAKELADGAPHYRAHKHLMDPWVQHAVDNADAELLTILLKNGADPDSQIQSFSGGQVITDTPRDRASRLRTLLDDPDAAAGDDADQRAAYHAEMLLHRFGEDAKPMADVVLAALDTPVDETAAAEIAEAANPTVTPEMLEEAVQCGNVAMIQLAEVQRTPVPAETAAVGLCRAVGDGNVAMIEVLLDVGADPTQDVTATRFTTQAGDTSVNARDLAARMKKAVHDGPPQGANPLMAMQQNLGESMQKLLSGELTADPPTVEEMEADPNSSLSMMKRLAEAKSPEDAHAMMTGMLSGGSEDPVDSWIEYWHGHYQRNIRDPEGVADRIAELLQAD